MGFYARAVFPRICDLLLDRPFVARYRQELLAQVSGEALEIGFGTGLNLRHYPKDIRKLSAVDPNPGMRRLAEERIRQSGIEVDYRVNGAEELPFPDETFDCAVSTWALCSVADVDRALREIHRVLKPGGRFLLLEHGLCPEPNVQKWQRRLNWLERRLGVGCRLDLNVPEVIARQPFRSVEVEKFYLDKTPRTHGTMYRGTALK
jgi:ubiquinone/menaquinone biosynthesis C-methylase UbiE